MKRGSSPAGEEAGDRDAPTLSVILPGVNEILSSAPLLPSPPPLPPPAPRFLPSLGLAGCCASALWYSS